MRDTLTHALDRGTREHYVDAEGYDHEYRRRRDDVAFYLDVAAKHAGGAPILELGCGSGRLTLPLARAGHRIVGVDASQSMLERTRARLASLPERLARHVRLVEGDFRALRTVVRGRHPLVICPFNTFQHLYERADVEAFLDGVRASLAPGGRFVFDLMNPDLRWLSRDPNRRWARTRYKDPRTGAWMIYSTEIVYDAPLQIAFVTVFYERADGGGRGRRTLLTQRHFFPRELEALLHYNGFEVVRRDGDFSGGALEPGSEQQVMWCRVAPRRSRRKTSRSRRE
jgi:SAM-dependent methyltransferase